MSDFFRVLFQYINDCIPITLVAVFIENIIFTRALGASTTLLIIRRKYNLLSFGAIILLITTLSSVFVYLIEPVITDLSYVNYIRPLIYIAIISIIYIILVIVISKIPKISNSVLPLVHLSAFNCAVLGALLLANQTNLRFSQFIGFGLGTGIGFVFATYLISLGYDKLNSENVPAAFRGLPATFIYIGILSLAFYGLVGSELPF